MREYTFTICRHTRDKLGEVITRTWNDWIPLFLEHTIIGRPEHIDANKLVLNAHKNHRAIIFGKTDGRGRLDKNILEIHAMALDFDNSSEQELLNYVLPTLEPYEYVAYTTHKHGSALANGIPRIRIVLPLENSYLAAFHRTYWERLNVLVGGRNDPSTKNESRLNFLPSTFDKSVAESFHHPGIFLNPEKLPSLQSVSMENIADSDEDVLAVKGRLVAKIKRLPSEDTRKEPLLCLLTCRDYAPPGEGHTILLACINYLAGLRKIEREHFQTIFGPAIELHARCSKTPETIESAWRDYNQRQTFLETKRRKDALGISKYTPYTDAEFEHICKMQNVETREDLRERWILQYNSSAWFLSKTGEYVGPFPKNVRTLQMKFELSRAVDLFTPAKNNIPPQLMTYTEASMKYATPLNDVQADLARQKSELVLGNKIVLKYAINPIRTDLNPRYDSFIDEWLQILGGSHYNKLLDWLSVYMNLDIALCAIYFAGRAGCGKSLFAQGISKLWTDGPATDLVEVLGDFNAGIDRCPILFGDENIQMSYRKVTAEIRKLLGNPARKFKEKYLSPIDIKGYLRIILAANHDKMLRDHEQKTKEDLEAIARRVLFIEPPAEAASFLERPEVLARVKHWGERGLAEHALWLKENHTILERGNRFVVEGDLSSMTTGLAMTENMPNFVCEVIVKFLYESDESNRLLGLILKKSNEVYATVSGVQEGWKIYMKHTREFPETRPIAQALRVISNDRKKSVRPPGGNARKYWHIEKTFLFTWAEENSDFEVSEIQELIGIDSTGQSFDTPPSNVVPFKDRNEQIDY